MSYNGTVTCRHCYQRGHNKRTCPDYTEKLRGYAQNEVTAGEGQDGYWHQQYAKRTGTWVDGTCAKEQKKGRRDAGQKRRCTYCGKQGHNRRSCETLVADCTSWASQALDFRRRIVADMRERGLGIGALVLQERWNEKYLSLVDNILWEQITHQMGNNDILAGQRVGHGQRRWSGGYPESDFNPHSYHKAQVVGPVGPAAVDATLPEDFFDGAVLMKLAKVAKKEHRSDDYHDNLYNYE